MGPKVSLSLSGTVNGAVAVYSPKSLVIEGSLEYLSNASLEQGRDFLGLVSGRSVIVSVRNDMPNGDLHTQAAIYAKNRFVVTQLLGEKVGTLKIFGSVGAGSLSATEPRYATRIAFDSRFEDLRPPGFPLMDRYELVASKESWEVNEGPVYETLDELEDRQLEFKSAEELEFELSDGV